MSDLQAIADRVEIEALRGEFTDAVMMHDYDRLASLFTQDGTVRLPHAYAGAVGREDMRAGGEQLQALLDYMVQTTHPGTIVLDGDTASGRAYLLRWSGRTPMPSGSSRLCQKRASAWMPRIGLPRSRSAIWGQPRACSMKRRFGRTQRTHWTSLPWRAASSGKPGKS